MSTESEPIPDPPSEWRSRLPVEKPEPPPGGIAMTVEEYLAWSRKQEERYEYSDGYAIPREGVEVLENGEIRAMSGTTPTHNRISGNVYNALDRLLDDRPCDVFFADIRVRVASGKFRYPDVVALCGPPQFDEDNPPCLLNPVVIVEVLSPSTQAADMSVKFEEYRQITSFTDYLLIAQERISVIHYVRQTPAQWVLTEYTALSDTVTLASLNVALSLADIYRKLHFA